MERNEGAGERREGGPRHPLPFPHRCEPKAAWLYSRLLHPSRPAPPVAGPGRGLAARPASGRAGPGTGRPPRQWPGRAGDWPPAPPAPLIRDPHR